MKICLKIIGFLCRPSPTNDNDNASGSGSDSSTSIESSSEDGTKNEPAMHWSLDTFVKPVKPVEKIPSLTVPQVKSEQNDNTSSKESASTRKSLQKRSPKCLKDEQIKQESIGENDISCFSKNCPQFSFFFVSRPKIIPFEAEPIPL